MPAIRLFLLSWAEARLKIARMTLTIKLDGNWSSFQLANSAPPLSVTDSALAPSARIVEMMCCRMHLCGNWQVMLSGVSHQQTFQTPPNMPSGHSQTNHDEPALAFKLYTGWNMSHHCQMAYDKYGSATMSTVCCRLYLHRITITVIFLCSRNKSDLPF